MKRCLMCEQSVNAKQDFYRWLKCDSLLCGECLSKWQPIRKTCNHNGMKLHILYEYNDFIENMLFQYKEGMDVALRTSFLHEDRRYIEKRYKGYTMLLMPSSQEKTKERGFHALKEMSAALHMKKLQPFYKCENRKQSMLNYEERLNIHKIIGLDDSVKLPKKKLLLFDDVCTSGATLLSAFQLLKQKNIQAEALVLCAHPLFLKNHN